MPSVTLSRRRVATSYIGNSRARIPSLSARTNRYTELCENQDRHRQQLTKQMTEVSTISMPAFSFVLGLKHAIEADHIAAVSTIASEDVSIARSRWCVRGNWAHISLLVPGAAIVFLHIEINGRTTVGLERFSKLLLGLYPVPVVSQQQHRPHRVRRPSE